MSYSHKDTVFVRSTGGTCAAALVCWLVGIAFPFYGTLNSVIGALCGPVVAFGMPALAFNITYWCAQTSTVFQHTHS